MRIFIMSAMLLSACASLPQLPTKSQKTLPSNHIGLTAQELARGECGIFFWTINSSPVFTFFQKEGSLVAKYLNQGHEVALDVNSTAVAFQGSNVLDITYDMPSGRTLQIKGKFADMLEGGQRIADASIQTQSAEGWQEIAPVSGVYVCR